MKKLRAYGNVICAFMAAILLNVSIDVPDELIYSPRLNDETSVNEMESIAEFVFEECLDEEGSFPETEDDDTGNVVKKNVELKSSLHDLAGKVQSPGLLLRRYSFYVVNYNGLDFSRTPYMPPRG